MTTLYRVNRTHWDIDMRLSSLDRLILVYQQLLLLGMTLPLFLNEETFIILISWINHHRLKKKTFREVNTVNCYWGLKKEKSPKFDLSICTKQVGTLERDSFTLHKSQLRESFKVWHEITRLLKALPLVTRLPADSCKGSVNTIIS